VEPLWYRFRLYLQWFHRLVYIGSMSNRSVQTSMRFSEAEIELIDSVRAVQERKHGLRLSRADVFRMLLQRLTPASDPGEAERRWREAYAKVFES